MIKTPFITRTICRSSIITRWMSTNTNSSKRFIQTGVSTNPSPKDYVPYKLDKNITETNDTITEKLPENTGSAWAKHTLSSRSFGDIVKQTKNKKSAPVKEEAKPTPTSEADTTAGPSLSATPRKRRRALKPRKALITLSPNAIVHLQGLLDQPNPQMIRIGVKNRGCSGLTYNLEYISEPQKFDEIVEQDGVKVVIDSKALFSVVGSEMDWLDDKLSSRFIFRNPNSKGTCGCGESFMV